MTSSNIGGIPIRFKQLGPYDVPRVDTDILGRVDDMYSGREGSTPKDSGGNNQLERGASGAYLTGVLRTIAPSLAPALEALNFASGQQFNMPGRRARIQELAGDENKRGTYDATTNQYSGLNLYDRILDIRPDDVTSQIADTRKKTLENQPAIQALKLELGQDDFNAIFPKGAATSNVEVESLVSEIDTRKGLLSKIEENMGTGLLNQKRTELGRKLTNTELRQLNDQAFQARPDQKRLADESASRLLTAETQRDVSKGTLAVNQGTLALARDKEKNANALARAEIDYKNDTNEYNYRNAERERELKRDLTLLGFEDKDADRKYDREERRDQMRQLLIMQMMKGLENFGSAFAL